MRAIGIKRFGGVEVLDTITIEAPSPGPGQVRVKVAYAGVNRIDAHVRSGAFLGRSRDTTDGPLVLGYEGAGTVDAVGENVAGIAIGTRVAWCGIRGAYAELAVVPAWQLVPVPDAMPLDVACALQLDGVLAHALSVSVFPIQKDDRVLIQSGGDPVALLLTQIAKAQGAEVVATVATNSDVAALLEAGADYVVLLAADKARAEIQEATRGQGCHVVYDAGGRDTIALSLASCRRRGMVVLYEARSGAVEQINPVDLAASGSLYLTRPHLSDFMQDATEVRWRTEGLFSAWQSGRLKVGIGRAFALEAAREAHVALEAKGTRGKILLKV
ncbi:MAG: quinone oxidoreductase [Hyphomicrobiaceae bacterium]